MAFATVVMSVANRDGGTEGSFRRTMVDTTRNRKAGRLDRARATWADEARIGLAVRNEWRRGSRSTGSR